MPYVTFSVTYRARRCGARATMRAREASARRRYPPNDVHADVANHAHVMLLPGSAHAPFWLVGSRASAARAAVRPPAFHACRFLPCRFTDDPCRQPAFTPFTIFAIFRCTFTTQAVFCFIMPCLLGEDREEERERGEEER